MRLRTFFILALMLVVAAPVFAQPANAGAPIDTGTLDPRDKELFTKLFEARRGLRKIEDVMKEYQRKAEAKATPREQALNRFFYGKLLLINQREEEAKAQWRAALQLYPAFPAAHVALGFTAVQAGDTREATKAAKRALRIDPQYLRAYLLLAQIAQAEDKWEKALTRYKQAVGIDPTNSNALRGMAMCHVQLFKDTYDADRQKNHARRAKAIAGVWVDNEPDSAEARVFESIVYFELGDLDMAVTKLENTLTEVRDLTDADRKLCLGRIFLIHAQRGEVEKAKEALRRVLKLKDMTGPERAEFEDRLADLERRGLDARVFWEIERRIKVLANRGINAAERREAMRDILNLLSDERLIRDPRFTEIADKAFRAAVKTLKDAPPELSIDIMQFFRHRMPDPLLIRIIVHFVFPNGIERQVTESVRVEATRSLAVVGGKAALPSLLYTLRDDSRAVSRAIDIALCNITERRSPISAGAGPVTAREQKILRREWIEWAESNSGAEMLSEGVLALQKAITGNAKFNRNQRKNPVGEHIISVILLDNDMKWEAWKTAYEFIRTYFAKDFLPAEMRGTKLTPELRPVIVKEIDAWFAGGAMTAEEAEDRGASEPAKDAVETGKKGD